MQALPGVGKNSCNSCLMCWVHVVLFSFGSYIKVIDYS